MKKFYFTIVSILLANSVVKAQIYHSLAGGSFLQNWTNISLITTNDNWSNVPSIIGYRGDDLVTTNGVDPQTIVAPGFATPINVIANQTTPDALSSGGIAEFEITNPSIAVNGSNTADAPFIVFFINTTTVTGVRVRYNLRDLDGSADNSVQPIALQYRIGNTGDFVNVPSAFVADASTGPSQATLVTAVDVILPTACDNQTEVQIRVITANASGNDEWIGIDDIQITPNLIAPVSNIIRDPNYIRISGNPSSEINIQFNRTIASEV